MMKIADWAKGKPDGFMPADVSRIFGLSPKEASYRVRQLCESGDIKRRRQQNSKHFRYFAVLPPEEQVFAEPEPRPECFPLIRLPEDTALSRSDSPT